MRELSIKIVLGSISIFYLGCTLDELRFKEVNIDISEAIPLIFEGSLNSDQNIYLPGEITTTKSGGIIIWDGSDKKIKVIDSEGIFLKDFGNNGRGPTELEDVNKFIIDDEGKLTVVDFTLYKVQTYSKNYDLISERIYHSKTHINEVEIMGDSLLLRASSKDSLLFLSDFNGSVQSEFGKPIINAEEDLSNYSIENFISDGDIIPRYQKQIMINKVGENIFVYFESYSILQCYNLNEELIWVKKINFPANKTLLSHAKDAAQFAGRFPYIRYIEDWKIINNEIFFLTTRTKEIPNLIVNLDTNGNLKKVYTFNPEQKMALTHLAIDINKKNIFVTDIYNGEVLKFKIPSL
jgi:hypothetical protein